MKLDRAARKRLSSAATVYAMTLIALVSLLVLAPILLRAGGRTGEGVSNPSPQNVGSGAPARYAVIDLGANFHPVAINNSGVIVGNINTPEVAAEWDPGGPIRLPPSDQGPGTAVAINDAGVIAGNAKFKFPKDPDKLESHPCSWATTTSAPVDLDSQTGNAIHDDPEKKYYSYATAIDGAGTVYGYKGWQSQNLPSQFSSNSPPTQLESSWHWHSSYSESQSPTLGGQIRAASGTNLVGGDFSETTGLNQYYSGFFVNQDTMAAPVNIWCYAGGINRDGVVVGSRANNAVMIQNGAITNLPGGGIGVAVNTHYATNVTAGTPPVTTVVAAPQIVGWDGAAMLWDQTMYDGTPTTNSVYIEKDLNKLIPQGTPKNPAVWNLQRPALAYFNPVDAINDAGVILGTAIKDENHDGKFDVGTYDSTTGTYSGPDKPHGVMLIPAELAVDADRNGTIVMANDPGNPANVDSSGNPLPVDTTSQAKPFRFWINNDDDATGNDTVPVSGTDLSTDYIVTTRDLEDWTRLWIYTKGLNQAIHDGSIKIGLKWKSVTGTPGIKIVKAKDSDGGLEYITDTTRAAAQAGSGTPTTLEQDDISHTTNITPTSNAADFVFSASEWSSLTETAPKTYFLFEGTGKGKGQLEIVFLKSDGTTKIGEGGNLWLDLHDIKEMYQRERAMPETIAAPYSSGSDDPAPISMTPIDDSGSFTFSPDPNETKDYFVFVHGWNMDYNHSTNYAETMFKRLWWRGYKGRFAAFRWPTYYSTVLSDLDPYGAAPISAALARFNDSEYIAWESGHALAQYVNSLPSGYTRHIASHSMGGIVVASALQQSSPMSVAYYALLHAAVPAYCYDTNTTLEDTYTAAGYVTPDHDSDSATSAMAYRGRVTSTGGAVLTSFYDATDTALGSWELNNEYTKPQPLDLYLGGHYFYSPSSANGQKLGLAFILETGRYMTDKYESMAYADKSLTLTVGAEYRTAGLINASIDTKYNYHFNGVHSAEFVFPIQQLGPYYYDLLKQLHTSENYLDSTHPTYNP